MPRCHLAFFGNPNSAALRARRKDYAPRYRGGASIKHCYVPTGRAMQTVFIAMVAGGMSQARKRAVSCSSLMQIAQNPVVRNPNNGGRLRDRSRY